MRLLISESWFSIHFTSTGTDPVCFNLGLATEAVIGIATQRRIQASRISNTAKQMFLHIIPASALKTPPPRLLLHKTVLLLPLRNHGIVLAPTSVLARDLTITKPVLSVGLLKTMITHNL